MNQLLQGFLFFFSLSLFAQESSETIEQFPVFPGCEGKYNKELQECFFIEVQRAVYTSFNVPQKALDTNYKGYITVLFEVNREGKFIVQYVDAIYPELTEESKKVFAAMPVVAPPTYAGNPTYSRYTIKIAIPLQEPGDENNKIQATTGKMLKGAEKKNKKEEHPEFDEIISKEFDNPHFKSHLNIPFTHSYYAQFDAALNQVGTNNHTASKPFTYAEVNKYYNLDEAYQKIKKDKSGWWGRKFWNEHIAAIQGEDYWLTLNPLVDLRVGKSNPGAFRYTYQNTRGIQVQGGLGSKLNFTSTIYESQGRFADYFNRYAESIRPSGGNPAIIPGVGIAKEFKTDAYDFPLAEANITFTPSHLIDLQLGYGRNFLGDGYRSLLTGDGASPYPFFKINTTFWKVKYTNTYMWLKDVRNEVTNEGTYATKFMANHYLSWNITKRWNLGFFESIVWSNSNDRGFDMSFVNPIIFYRAVEFASSSRSGNAVLGLTSKYKWNNRINCYGQFILDEFALGDVQKGNKSWRNKFGYQLGLKYFNAFGVDQLLLQMEYNHLRPYVYSHSNILTNYGHNNQSMGHQWGANFREIMAVARYFKGRWFGDAKITFGQRGLDFDTEENRFNYGSNIYKNYNDDRPFDTGVAVGQGNKTTIFIADVQAGYLINPTSNLKIFGSIIYRNFDPTQNTAATFKENTTWFSVGVRADLFNWYFDY